MVNQAKRSSMLLEHWEARRHGVFEGSQELGQLLRTTKKSIYLRRKSRGRKRPQLGEGEDSLGCTNSKEMDLDRQQASQQIFGSDVGAPSAAEHLPTFSLLV